MHRATACMRLTCTTPRACMHRTTCLHAPHHVPACTTPRACMHRTTCLHAPHHVPACTAPRACMHRTTCLHAGSRQATETAESPTLPTPLVEWIVTLCDEVHQLVLEVRLARSPPCPPVAIPRPNHDCHPNRNCHPRCQTRCAISSHPPLNTSQGSADTSGIFPGQAERCP